MKAYSVSPNGCVLISHFVVVHNDKLDTKELDRYATSMKMQKSGTFRILTGIEKNLIAIYVGNIFFYFIRFSTRNKREFSWRKFGRLNFIFRYIGTQSMRK